MGAHRLDLMNVLLFPLSLLLLLLPVFMCQLFGIVDCIAKGKGGSKQSPLSKEETFSNIFNLPPIPNTVFI